ncbi:2-C-methyl-D-erythritol 4-phosphate cytidylyltransferase [Teredinibacter purpureus]|uniref:2-C-methyl-D-erythritol 4-phosphate cytidylyltransferase n=1 Tax=Teredinibacter purpureus TaxID=2731756 RepID=UPI00069722D6|nr:2-C-methyl-D-erythritol 4-phosphate cytidylyltransferase [Teredinibacter purpureus]
MTDTKKIWAVVPAAGIGQRMEGAVPKQYLPLAGKTVLETTLEKLLELELLAGVVVAINARDTHWQKTSLVNHPKVFICLGGKERSDSVLNALNFVQSLGDGAEEAWVLVHDAARPCVTLDNIRTLIDLAFTEKCGAILASAVSDTLKRVHRNNIIAATEDRSTLWQAHTPQFFPLQKLRSALEYCREKDLPVTDEASAIEQVGGKVLVLADRRDNIKVTMPEDLAWAEFILDNQGLQV